MLHRDARLPPKHNSRLLAHGLPREHASDCYDHQRDGKGKGALIERAYSKVHSKGVRVF